MSVDPSRARRQVVLLRGASALRSGRRLAFEIHDVGFRSCRHLGACDRFAMEFIAVHHIHGLARACCLKCRRSNGLFHRRREQLVCIARTRRPRGRDLRIDFVHGCLRSQMDGEPRCPVHASLKRSGWEFGRFHTVKAFEPGISGRWRRSLLASGTSSASPTASSASPGGWLCGPVLRDQNSSCNHK